MAGTMTSGGLRHLTLLASTTVAAAGTTTATTTGIDYATEAWFLLKVTAAATDATDTLNVYVQRTPDGGTTWDDLVSFTQLAGNGGAKTYQARWQMAGFGAAPENEEGAVEDGALAAGNVNQGGILGDQLRVKTVAAETNDVSYTYSLDVLLAGGRQI